MNFLDLLRRGVHDVAQAPHAIAHDVAGAPHAVAQAFHSQPQQQVPQQPAPQRPAMPVPQAPHPNLIHSFANVASKVVAQVNPLDNGRTFKHNQATNDGSLIHQVTHNGLTNATGALSNNITGSSSAIDAGRLGVAELTHNQGAADRATTSLAKNLPRFAPIALAEGSKQGLQMAANAITSPYAEHVANQEAQRAQRELGNHTGDRAHDAAVEAYASGIKTDLLNSQLSNGGTGIDMKTSKKDLVRKVGAAEAQVGANMLFASQMGNGLLAGKAANALGIRGAAEAKAAAANATKQSLAKQVGLYGGTNAAASVAGAAQLDNPHLKDYLKAGTTGFASGAAFPLAGKALPIAVKGSTAIAKGQASAAKELFTGIQNPHPDVSPEDYMALRRVTNQAQGGPELGHPVTAGDLVATRSLLKQKGFDPNDLGAADRIVNQINGYEAKKQALNGGYVNLPGGKTQLPKNGKPTTVTKAADAAKALLGDMQAPALPKGLHPLAEEAKKYGSADEFTQFLMKKKAEGDPSTLALLKTMSTKAQKLMDGGMNAASASKRVVQEYHDIATLEPHKYPDAESFIKAQGKPLYHGTDANFDRFSLSNFGKTDEGFSGKGVYLSARKANAKQYGKNIVESYPKLTNPMEYKDSYSFGAFSPGTLRKHLGLSPHASADTVTAELKRRGHDGLVIHEVTGNGLRKSEEVVVLDPSKIKTKQELTDLYNQVHNKGITSDQAGSLNIGEIGHSIRQAVKKFSKPLDQAGSAPLIEDGSVVPTIKKLTGGKQATELSSEAAPTKLPGEQAGGIASGNSTPVDVKQYVKEQVQAQEAARKAGNPSGLGTLRAPLADAKTKLVDSLAPIEDTLNQKITAENATSHITPQLDRALRADTIAAQYMKDNGLAHVIQRVPDTKAFDQYLIAKHAQDLEANGVKTGRDLNADRQVVQALKDTYEPHAQAINKYSQDLLDKAADYGLISKELATHLKEKYPNYVPANRIFGEGELPKPPNGAGGGKASIGTQSVVQRIKGSDRAIESPLSSIINKTQQVIDQGERNKAAQILTGYRNLPGNPFSLRELGKTETVGTKPVISVLENGVKRQFETTPEIAAAAKSLNKEQLGLIGKILAVPTRVLRLGATGLNPAFAGANIIKDLASGAINSKNPLRSSVANPRVFLKALVAATNHNSPEYGELVREGAGGTSFDIARDAPVQNVKSIRAQKNVGTKIAYTVTHPAQLFRVAENTIGRSEEFSRALQYYGGKEASLAKNASPEAARVMAAHAARNNTVNFARGGDYTKVLNSVLPYLNAGVQGSRTLIRNIGDRPAQTAAKLAVLGFFPTAAVTAWNLSDPRRKAAYDDIKEYEKQGNLVIVPPNPKKDAGGKWNVIKIPVSQEIANLNNIVRNGIETGAKDGTMKIGDLAGNLIGTVSSLNAQNPRQIIGQVTPQAIKPVIESVVNQNLFTGNKIVPDSQKNLDPKDQYGNTTSGTARVAGALAGLSPRHIDNAIRTATGGLGQNVVNLADKGLAAAGVIKPSDVKGKSFYDSITGRFAGAQGSGQYDVIDKKNAELTKQLKDTAGYKAMNPQDKAKALNRLTNQVTQAFTTKKTPSAKQQDIKNGKVDVNSYLTPSTGGKGTPIAKNINGDTKKFLTKYNATSADDRKKTSYSQKDYDYKVAQAQYENDKASGKLSRAGDIAAQDHLKAAKVGATFDKNIRDIYNLPKDDVYNLITTADDGASLRDQLLAYGDARKAAGIGSNKFRTSKGAVAFATKKSGSGGSGGSRSKGALKVATFHTIGSSNTVKMPKVKTSKGKVQTFGSRKLAFKTKPIKTNATGLRLKAKVA